MHAKPRAKALVFWLHRAVADLQSLLLRKS